MKVIILGFGKKTKIISFLKKKNIEVIELGQKKIDLKMINKRDLVLSFGYRKIISDKILKKLHRPIINLHISYLPYNRGAHPNFWSFIDNTPPGVTIHELDKGIDTGKIIFQKKIKFQLDGHLTFHKSYKILISEVEHLFYRHYKSLINYSYKTKLQKGNGTFHYSKNLPKNFNSWDVKILHYLMDMN
mgnify:CR=1 FL=1